MRTRYESAEDVANQEAVAVFLGALWRLEPRLVRGDRAWDYEMWSRNGHRMVYRVEVKCRQSGPFDELMISAHKWDALVEQDHQGGAKSLLVVRWPDETIWGVRADHYAFRREERGRTVQTRDEWDEELCVFVPGWAMTQLA